MPKLIALDYGKKYTGIATTDPQQTIATPLKTIHTHHIITFLKQYTQQHHTQTIIIGKPQNPHNNKKSHTLTHIQKFIQKLQLQLPNLTIHTHNEQFTTHIAKQTLLHAKLKKTQRQSKKLLNTTAATIILQSYLNTTQKKKAPAKQQEP